MRNNDQILQDLSEVWEVMRKSEENERQDERQHSLKRTDCDLVHLILQDHIGVALINGMNLCAKNSCSLIEFTHFIGHIVLNSYLKGLQVGSELKELEKLNEK